MKKRGEARSGYKSGSHVRVVNSHLYKWLASNVGISEDVLRPVVILLLDIRQRFLFVRFSNLSLE